MKRIVAMLLVTIMLSSSFVYADDTIIIQQPKDVTITDSEETNIETEDVLVNANTVTINIKDGARLINGTVLRNLNLIVEDVSYKPTIDLSKEIGRASCGVRV